MQENFFVCVLGRWQLGFNDPYFLSWVMVAIYVFAAFLAAVVARRAPVPAATRRQERAFWAAVAGVLAIMAVNKQADLQTLIMATGSCLGQTQSWFEKTDLLKGIILTVLVLSAFGSGAVFVWALRPTLRRTALPLLGLALMAGFIVFRAAETLNSLGPLRAVARGNWPDRILELSGPLVIVIAAIILLNRRDNTRAAETD
ncbi:MAG: hypothetical protein KDK53_01935 [Maritimibacter sp.]|nr:hypothetical protein [Maritimibacter sp.]